MTEVWVLMRVVFCLGSGPCAPYPYTPYVFPTYESCQRARSLMVGHEAHAKRPGYRIDFVCRSVQRVGV